MTTIAIRKPRRVLIQYLALALTWGASFLFIKAGLEGLSPAQVVLGRLVFGAAALGIAAAATRHRVRLPVTVWAHLGVVAVLLCVVPFLLFAWAEEHISSGLASIFNAATPLMTLVATAAALRAERPGRLQFAGLLTGFAGVVLIIAPWGVASGAALGADLACLGATACYGAGFVYLRRFVSPLGLPSLTVAAAQVGLGAAIMLVLAPFLAAGPVHLTPPVLLAVAALGALGTGLAYVWNTNVVAGWGAANASSVTYLTPLAGVLLGALVYAEPVSWNEPAGGAVVILGIALSQDRLRPLVSAVHQFQARRAAGQPGDTSGH